jgi:drug/metabolite transporter (DMT)-like permease
VIYLVAIIAALCLGLGFVLQQHAAHRAPPSDFLRFRLLIDLLHKPIWIAGIVAMVIGQLLSASALATADISLVEPLLTANLLFALMFARLIYHQPLGLREWAGALLLSGGVAAFLVGGRPSGGNPDGDSLLRWVLAMGIGLLAWVCVVAARRHSGPPRAMLLATGAGLLFGIQDGLTRRTTQAYHGNLAAVFAQWTPYVLVANGIVGLLLAQSAFEAGSLQASLPALTASEPLAGIAVGIVVFQENLHVDPGALGLEVCGLVAMLIGVLLVGTGGTFGSMEVRRALAAARARGTHRPHLHVASVTHRPHAAHPNKNANHATGARSKRIQADR